MASSARDNILQKIGQALSNPVPLPFPHTNAGTSIFPAVPADLELLFAEQFTALQGRFAFCLNEADMVQQVQALILSKGWSQIYGVDKSWQDLFATTTDLAACDASITGCQLLVARTGSFVLTAAQQEGRTASVYAPIHICIAYTQQLVYDIHEAFLGLHDTFGEKLPSIISFASGPSRTADIEKTLVTGVHGPGEVYLFLVDNGPARAKTAQP